jgi:hypothetical protein
MTNWIALSYLHRAGLSSIISFAGGSSHHIDFQTVSALPLEIGAGYSQFTPGRASSSDQNLFLNSVFGQTPKNVGPAIFKYQFNSLPQIVLGFVNRLSLPVGARTFGADRPVTAFRCRFDDCCEFCLHDISFRILVRKHGLQRGNDFSLNSRVNCTDLFY